MESTDVQGTDEGIETADEAGIDQPNEATEVEGEGDTQEDAGKTVTHSHNVGSVVTSVDGKSTAEGELIHGLVLGHHQDGRPIVAWLPHAEAVEADSLTTPGH